MIERTTPKEPIELAWDEYVASMEGRPHGQTDAFKFAWMAAQRERVLFPTMLRKMWSGGEVQQWIDENVNKEKNT